MNRYLVTLKDGTRLEMVADRVELTDRSTGRSVVLGAREYDELDLEAAHLMLGGEVAEQGVFVDPEVPSRDVLHRMGIRLPADQADGLSDAAIAALVGQLATVDFFGQRRSIRVEMAYRVEDEHLGAGVWVEGRVQ